MDGEKEERRIERKGRENVCDLCVLGGSSAGLGRMGKLGSTFSPLCSAACSCSTSH